jgi:hypothetical protein
MWRRSAGLCQRNVLIDQAAGGAREGGRLRGVTRASSGANMWAPRSVAARGAGTSTPAGGAAQSPPSLQQAGQAMQATACPESRPGCSWGADELQSPGAAVPAAAIAEKLTTTACSAMA